jgi:hypothetical protein
MRLRHRSCASLGNLMATPRVEQVRESGKPARIYFHDADGITWRVHDRAFGPPFAVPLAYLPQRR